MDYIVETDFEGPGFVAVPNHVLDVPGLSPEAIGLLVWFARQPRGFIARASAVQDRFGIGKDRWQRIARELRATGAIRLVRLRATSGRLAGGHYVIRWPSPARDPMKLEVPEMSRVHKPENPAHGPSAGKTGSWKTRSAGPGNPAAQGRETRPLTKDKDEKESAREKAGRVAARSAAPRADATRAATGREGEGALAPSLTAFQRSRVLSGQSVLIDGVPVVPGSPAFEALCQAVRGQSAEKMGVAHGS